MSSNVSSNIDYNPYDKAEGQLENTLSVLEASDNTSTLYSGSGGLTSLWWIQKVFYSFLNLLGFCHEIEPVQVDYDLLRSLYHAHVDNAFAAEGIQRMVRSVRAHLDSGDAAPIHVDVRRALQSIEQTYGSCAVAMGDQKWLQLKSDLETKITTFAKREFAGKVDPNIPFGSSYLTLAEIHAPRDFKKAEGMIVEAWKFRAQQGPGFMRQLAHAAQQIPSNLTHLPKEIRDGVVLAFKSAAIEKLQNHKYEEAIPYLEKLNGILGDQAAPTFMITLCKTYAQCEPSLQVSVMEGFAARAQAKLHTERVQALLELRLIAGFMHHRGETESVARLQNQEQGELRLLDSHPQPSIAWLENGS